VKTKGGEYKGLALVFLLLLQGENQGPLRGIQRVGSAIKQQKNKDKLLNQDGRICSSKE
jgi:hypothetical protein